MKIIKKVIKNDGNGSNVWFCKNKITRHWKPTWVMYQTCGFKKAKSQHSGNKYKIINKFKTKGDQTVVFIIFNALNRLK